MAFYSEDVIEEIKAANDIVDVVSGYVNLKRRGNNYFGLCPFHNEKTPSFSVSADKQIFHCFGCSQGGNVFAFISKIENIGYKEAIEYLAEKSNIKLPTLSANELDLSQAQLLEREKAKKNMYEINKLAGRFFYDNISKSQVAQDYINKRGLSPKTVAKFGLGFALNDNGLCNFLLKQGFSEQDMIATGLVGKTNSGQLYDKFKDRFMFPIFDLMDRVVAFGGRTLLSKEEMKQNNIPKYVNSPENLIYTKGKHLYGLNLARKTGEKMKKILVVEGYMDVITPVQAGVTNVVASLGTALTQSQGRLLRKYADEVVLSYDSDDAGQKAILRGLDVMQSLGVMAKVLQMENAKDPDEYVLQFGPERFEKLIDNSISYIEYKALKLKNDYNLNDLTDRIKFLDKLSEILANIDSNIERDIYIDRFSKDLNVGKEAIIAEVEKKMLKNENKGVINKKYAPAIINSNINKNTLELEKMVLYLLLTKDKEVFNSLKETFSINDIKSDIYKPLIIKLYELYEKGDIINKDLMLIAETDDESNILSELLINNGSNEENNKLLNEVIRKIKISKLEEEKASLLIKLHETQNEEEIAKIEQRMQEIISLLAKR